LNNLNSKTIGLNQIVPPIVFPAEFPVPNPPQTASQANVIPAVPSQQNTAYL